VSIHCKHTHALVSHLVFVIRDYALQPFKSCFIWLSAINIDEQIRVAWVIIIGDFLFKHFFQNIGLWHILGHNVDIVVELSPTLHLEVFFIAIWINFKNHRFVRESIPSWIHRITTYSLFIIYKFIFHLQLQRVFYVFDKWNFFVRDSPGFFMTYLISVAYFSQKCL